MNDLDHIFFLEPRKHLELISWPTTEIMIQALLETSKWPIPCITISVFARKKKRKRGILDLDLEEHGCLFG